MSVQATSLVVIFGIVKTSNDPLEQPEKITWLGICCFSKLYGEEKRFQ